MKYVIFSKISKVVSVLSGEPVIPIRELFHSAYIMFSRANSLNIAEDTDTVTNPVSDSEPYLDAVNLMPGPAETKHVGIAAPYRHRSIEVKVN